MDLSVITVNFNDKGVLDQIKAVKLAAEGLSCEEIISDNGSSDGSGEEIQRLFPEIKIIENKANIGFGAANNRALPFASGEFLLFLNPDMRPTPGSFKKLVDLARQRPDIGILSCRLTDESGRPNEKAKPRRFPTILNQLAVLLKLPHFFPSLLNKYFYADLNLAKESEVDSVRGSFMLMRREIVKRLGRAFDPRYFIWFEDVDICREAKRLGFKVIYTPLVSCVDYVGLTFKKMPFYWKQKNFTASMLKYFKKWESWHKWIWLAVLRPFVLALAFIKERFSK